MPTARPRQQLTITAEQGLPAAGTTVHANACTSATVSPRRQARTARRGSRFTALRSTPAGKSAAGRRAQPTRVPTFLSPLGHPAATRSRHYHCCCDQGGKEGYVRHTNSLVPRHEKSAPRSKSRQEEQHEMGLAQLLLTSSPSAHSCGSPTPTKGQRSTSAPAVHLLLDGVDLLLHLLCAPRVVRFQNLCRDNRRHSRRKVGRHRHLLRPQRQHLLAAVRVITDRPGPGSTRFW